MRTPPFLLGAVLLFWGWETGFTWVAAFMSITLELSRGLKSRWEFSDKEFIQLWDLCVLVFMGAGVYALAANEGAAALSGLFSAQTFAERTSALNHGSRAAQTFIQWLPMMFFPFMAAQAYSQSADVELATFSLWLRRQRRFALKRGLPIMPGRRINVSYPYLGICLAGACALETEARSFYIGFAVLIAWTLWSVRNPRFALPVWAGCLMLAAALGFAGGLGLERLQVLLENLPTQWMSRFARHNASGKETRTALGEMGRIKLSGKILLRLEVPKGQSPPALLREASYSVFRSPVWLASSKTFGDVIASTNDSSWVLLPGAQAERSLRIAESFSDGKGLLALPAGVTRIDDLQVAQVETNRLGVTQMSGGPGLAVFSAGFREDVAMDGPPDIEDSDVPRTEAPAMARIVEQLGLSRDPTSAASRVAEFFQTNFRYQLLLDPPRSGSEETPLGRFLLQTRAGHCEYFAAATTLLLRQAGVPARYVIGFSVQEKAGAGKFVVRERHAHAWCRYYDWNARLWRDLDTTPGSWFADEARLAHFWEPLSDAISRVWFEFQKLRWGRSGLRQYVFAGLLLALVVAGLRFFIGKRWHRQAGPAKSKPISPLEYPGVDSEFYLVEQQLTARGLERRHGETLRMWLDRIEPAARDQVGRCRELLDWHYRYRFDPAGLTPSARGRLAKGAHAWLAGSARN